MEEIKMLKMIRKINGLSTKTKVILALMFVIFLGACMEDNVITDSEGREYTKISEKEANEMIKQNKDLEQNVELEETEAPTPTKKPTEKPTKKPTPKKIVENTVEYKQYSLHVLLRMTKIFEDITKHCGELDLLAVDKDINNMIIIKEELKTKKTPKEYSNFKNKMIKIIEYWESAYAYMLAGDSNGVTFETTKANTLLTEIANEYGVK
jgi:hypothetical protein